jgi:hypothetical protein
VWGVEPPTVSTEPGVGPGLGAPLQDCPIATLRVGRTALRLSVHSPPGPGAPLTAAVTRRDSAYGLLSGSSAVARSIASFQVHTDQQAASRPLSNDSPGQPLESHSVSGPTRTEPNPPLRVSTDSSVLGAQSPTVCATTHWHPEPSACEQRLAWSLTLSEPYSMITLSLIPLTVTPSLSTDCPE